MRSWLKDTRLSESGRLQYFNYDIGIADENNYGSDIRCGELMCRFDGIMRTIDFIEKNEKAFGNRRPSSRDSSYKKRDSDSWTLFETYDLAVEAMRKTPEVFRKFNESDMRLIGEESVGNMVEFDHQGDYIDIGKVLAGEPECFGVMCGGKIENRFCSIVVNCNARCDVDKQAITRKASRTLRLVDMLETNGVRCEVGVVFTTHQVHCEIIVKQYNDPLDINELAIALSPDFFRWVIFRLTEHSKLKDGGYGQPLLSSLCEWQDKDADNTILVDGLAYNASTERIDNEFDDIEKQIKENEFASGKDYLVSF